MNRLRILSRIRSRHAPSSRARNKAHLLSRLTTAKGLLQNSSISSTRAQSFASEVDNLQRQFDCLEHMGHLEALSSRSEVHLLGLVKVIHSLLLQYEQDLKPVPYTPGLWSGNATESLIDRLRKISQYVGACEELLRAARRYRVFSNIDIEFVDLQQGGRRLSIGAVCDSEKVIEASCTRETLSRISSHQHLSESDTRKRIKARLGENSRLHAEIQLVLHFEQHPTLLRPRVICSSKSACYLCHLLLKIHNQYFIPSTHGKLYDTWKWPMPIQHPGTRGCHIANLNLQRLLPEFSNAIDHKIRDSLDRARTVRRIQPLESRVDLLATMTPSILSRISRSVCSAATYQQNVDIASADTDGINDRSSISSTDTVRGLGVDIPTRPMLDVKDSTSCNEIASPTMMRHTSRGSFMCSVWEGSVLNMTLQSGETINHSFTGGEGLLHVHVPG